ncbi:hypothetical protein, partial [Microcoleus sp. FACHB-1515]|uniref:hypothetical protein n=1 Tax=Cyanophyceae TaxID=3028117 RepID=UPI001A7E4B9E
RLLEYALLMALTVLRTTYLQRTSGELFYVIFDFSNLLLAMPNTYLRLRFDVIPRCSDLNASKSLAFGNSDRYVSQYSFRSGTVEGKRLGANLLGFRKNSSRGRNGFIWQIPS